MRARATRPRARPMRIASWVYDVRSGRRESTYRNTVTMRANAPDGYRFLRTAETVCTTNGLVASSVATGVAADASAGGASIAARASFRALDSTSCVMNRSRSLTAANSATRPLVASSIFWIRSSIFARRLDADGPPSLRRAQLPTITRVAMLTAATRRMSANTPPGLISIKSQREKGWI